MGELESFGRSSIPNNETALQRVADLIQEIQPGGMVQKFVLLIETIDMEGDDRRVSFFTAPGQKVWDTMGLLDFATRVEGDFKMVHDDDEGDDL